MQMSGPLSGVHENNVQAYMTYGVCGFKLDTLRVVWFGTEHMHGLGVGTTRTSDPCIGGICSPVGSSVLHTNV